MAKQQMRMREDVALGMVSPDVCAVAFHRDDFRQEISSKPLSSNNSKPRRAPPSVKYSRHFIADPFPMKHRVTAVAGLRIAANVAGSMANFRLAANRTARIMRRRSSSKRACGIANGADDAPPRSSWPSTKSMTRSSMRIVNHAVDGEVATPDVFLETAVAHMARVAAVQIRAVMTKTRDFERRAVDEHKNHAKLRADGERIWKNALNVFRSRGGGDVVVLRLFFEQHIAHAAAGEISLIAFAPQTLRIIRSLGRLSTRCTNPTKAINLMDKLDWQSKR